MILSIEEVTSVSSCPLKLKICHPACYWHGRSKCAFPPGGYDKRGHPIKKQAEIEVSILNEVTRPF